MGLFFMEFWEKVMELWGLFQCQRFNKIDLVMQTKVK
jgi:hypothetical protein